MRSCHPAFLDELAILRRKPLAFAAGLWELNAAKERGASDGGDDERRRATLLPLCFASLGTPNRRPNPKHPRIIHLPISGSDGDAEGRTFIIVRGG
jgi:hypothetical protein